MYNISPILSKFSSDNGQQLNSTYLTDLTFKPITEKIV